MAFITFKGVGIKAISACVPSQKVFNKDLGYFMPQDDIEKTINSIGIIEKRYAEPEVCASDLCFKAAQKLLQDNNIDLNSIDVLLFMSQTSDYKIPATAPILQHRLGLSKNVAALDLSLGCSGYVYALSTAFAYASMQGVNRVLLLVGETFSKIVNSHDKVNVPLYGDAGTATLIEKGDFGDSYFTLGSDGSGADAVKISAGGCRNIISVDNIKPSKKEDGNIRSDHELFMDGMDVFNFAISVVPKSIKDVLLQSNQTLADIDYIVLHQANKFMTDFIIKRLKYPLEKVPYCMDRFGNTSSASIPLTIVSELKNKIDSKNLLLCGFGAGLSWGSVVINAKKCFVSDLIDY